MGPPVLRHLARLLPLAAALACGEPEAAPPPDGPPATPAGPAPAASDPPAPEVVAVVDGEPIRRVELEAPLRLRLYELERRAHRLRRERLRAMIASRVAPDAAPEETAARVEEAREAGRVELRLEPPPRPRLAVPAGDAPARGETDAPVTLVVFCDFASSHCARFQPVLAGLREAFPRRVRVAHRDHPLPFHRHATEAAVAARCAGAQGAYFRYHDGLYTRERLDAETRRDLAQSLGLDVARLVACVGSDDGGEGAAAREAVREDGAIAARLGLPRVPTTFVNGLYVPGPATFEELAGQVRDELARLGVPEGPPQAATAADPRDIPLTDLPLRLVATVAHEEPARASATIGSPRFDQPRVFGPGERVLEDARLDTIEPGQVLLRRGDDRLERLPLHGGGGEAHAPPAPHRDAEGVLHVARERIDRALEEREALEADLQRGRLDLEGKRLLKLTEVEEGSLYDLLGLEPKDVLMQVDGVFVHDQYNPLFEALRTQQRVTVTIMRGGFPKTFEIAIE